MNTSVTITTRDLAAAHGVSLRTAQRWAATGKVNAVKVNGRWVITLQADLTAFTPVQIEKAAELLEQGGLIPTSREALYFAVASDGTTHYLVDALERSCTCKAGAHGVRCYHLAAALVLTTARAARAA